VDFGDQRLPLRIETRPLVTVLRFFEIRQSFVIVLALARIDDPNAQSTEDFRSNARVGFGETLSRGLGNVMAQTFDLGVAGTFQSFGEFFRFPSR